MFLNVVVGIVGAMLGGWLISPLVGVGTINQNNFSLPAMLVSFVGAAILLAIVNLFRRGTARWWLRRRRVQPLSGAHVRRDRARDVAAVDLRQWRIHAALGQRQTCGARRMESCQWHGLTLSSRSNRHEQPGRVVDSSFLPLAWCAGLNATCGLRKFRITRPRKQTRKSERDASTVASASTCSTPPS